jgi:hypothetical protein
VTSIESISRPSRTKSPSIWPMSLRASTPRTARNSTVRQGSRARRRYERWEIPFEEAAVGRAGRECTTGAATGMRDATPLAWLFTGW